MVGVKTPPKPKIIKLIYEENNMNPTILVAIISAVVSLVGTAIGAYSGAKLTAYRMQQLEKKVHKHNGFAEKMPVIEEQIKVINHKISDLERK